jgi:hypothetical protein
MFMECDSKPTDLENEFGNGLGFIRFITRFGAIIIKKHPNDRCVLPRYKPAVKRRLIWVATSCRLFYVHCVQYKAHVNLTFTLQFTPDNFCKQKLLIFQGCMKISSE